MRISDWSSDVCSSDLTATLPPALFLQTATPHHHLMAPAPITSKNEPRPHNPRANDHPAARRTAQRLRRRLDPPGRAAVLALADAIQHQRQLHLAPRRSEEHTSELQSLMRISYAVFCLKKKKHTHTTKLS